MKLNNAKRQIQTYTMRTLVKLPLYYLCILIYDQLNFIHGELVMVYEEESKQSKDNRKRHLILCFQISPLFFWHSER